MYVQAMGETVMEVTAPSMPAGGTQSPPTKMTVTEPPPAEDTELPQTKVTVTPPQSGDVEVVKCYCCKLTEDCTRAYITRVRERYQGHWICGLCAEAVKDEIGRSKRRISTEEALNRHSNFCEKFRSCTPPSKPTEKLINAVKQLLIRSLDSPSGVRSNPNSPRGNDGSDLAHSAFGRSQSCFPSLDA